MRRRNKNETGRGGKRERKIKNSRYLRLTSFLREKHLPRDAGSRGPALSGCRVLHRGTRGLLPVEHGVGREGQLGALHTTACSLVGRLRGVRVGKGLWLLWVFVTIHIGSALVAVEVVVAASQEGEEDDDATNGASDDGGGRAVAAAVGASAATAASAASAMPTCARGEQRALGQRGGNPRTSRRRSRNGPRGPRANACAAPTASA